MAAQFSLTFIGFHQVPGTRWPTTKDPRLKIRQTISKLKNESPLPPRITLNVLRRGPGSTFSSPDGGDGTSNPLKNLHRSHCSLIRRPDGGVSVASGISVALSSICCCF